MSVLLLLASLSTRAEALEPVLESVDEGVGDWTNLRLVVHGSAGGGAGEISNLQTAEGDARDQIAPRVARLARAVRVDRTRAVGALLDAGDAVSDRLESNLSAWEVYEARYYASGNVQLDAAISLQSWLRPALVGMAHTPERAAAVGGASGLVVDARGQTLSCALAPEFFDASGQHLYGIADMTQFTVSLHGPVVYVRDPADPVAVRRAGEAPLFVLPDRVQDSTDLVFSAEVSQAIRSAAESSEFLLRGNVVVVVSP